MGTKYKNLKDQICDWNNILLAYNKTAQGKKSTRSYLEFKEFHLLNLRKIQKELINGTYQMDPSFDFTLYVPKERMIKALSFRDRVVQHAIHNIVEPIFDKSFLPFTYACRNEKGTHVAVKHVQSIMRKSDQPLYYLKTDFRKYFRSIEYDRLHDIIKRKISCQYTLNLLKIFFPVGGKELPVGWLLSQLFANVYGSVVDYHIHHVLKQRNWARYMDDIVIFSHDRDELVKLKDEIIRFSDTELNLKLSKWYIYNVNHGLNFLGYRIWPDHKLIRTDSVVRAKRKVYKYMKYQQFDKFTKFIGSWKGHIQWADCYNLKKWMDINYVNHQYP
jgi:retron-type reverse transcriptase